MKTAIAAPMPAPMPRTGFDTPLPRNAVSPEIRKANIRQVGQAEGLNNEK